MHKECIFGDDGHQNAKGKKKASCFEHEMCFRAKIDKKKGGYDKKKKMDVKSTKGRCEV